MACSLPIPIPLLLCLASPWRERLLAEALSATSVVDGRPALVVSADGLLSPPPRPQPSAGSGPVALLGERRQRAERRRPGVKMAAEIGALGLISSSSSVSQREAFPSLGDIVRKIADIGSTLGNAVGSASDAAGNVAGKIGGVAGVAGSVADIVDSIVDTIAGVDEKTANPGILDKIEDWAKRIEGGSAIVGNVSEVLGELSDQVTRAMDSLRAFAIPVERGGNSTPHINRLLCILLGIVVLVVLASIAAERFFPFLRPAKGRPRLWCLGMLVTSYGMLIPGLVEVLFSFTLAVTLLGLQVTVTRSQDGANQPGPVTESMMSVTHTLRHESAYLGTFFIELYSMVIPALKLVLLIIGELFRFSTNAWLVTMARWSIRIVQVVSKWACPDMFAYILILYLMRSLNERSPLLAVPAHLDEGFVCFALFCVCSTFSSLAIELPERPEPEAAALEGEAPAKEEEEAQAPSQGLAFAISLILLVVFGILYAVGLLLPCMSLEIRTELLVEPRGPLPAVAMPFLQMLHLEDQVNSEVSLWKCLCALLRWWYMGEGTCVLAFIMLGVFAFLLPAANMILLVLAAHSNASQADGLPDKLGGWTSGAMDAARVIKHIEMLDVAIMGVTVIVAASASFRNQGVAIFMRSGLLFLLLAEIVHYVSFYVVHYASRSAKPADASAPTS